MVLLLVVGLREDVVLVFVGGEVGEVEGGEGRNGAKGVERWGWGWEVPLLLLCEVCYT